jgi:D-3-phosphoglycerate dehydrogenase / 2-oxoglutarate reductase
MMKILVLEPEYFDPDAIRVLSSVGRVTARRMKRTELLGAVGGFDVLVVRIEEKLDRELLSRARRLKAIGSATTGLDHIDLEYARSRGIKIFSLHGTHTVPTAEHTFALMLSLMRKIPWSYESLKAGHWKRYRFIGNQLSGKTLGIIGLGRIGSMVCGYAKAFGMNVIYYDPYVDSKLARRVGLKKLLGSSDVITVHAALGRSSRNELDRKKLSLVKRGAYLINTARADIIDYAALLEALEDGRIKGAALDVFRHEPVTKGEAALVLYARRNTNLLVTPHIAGSTFEAAHDAGLEIANDIAGEFGRKRG